MPLYDYEHEGPGCARGKRFTLHQVISEERLARCPDCGEPIRRLIGRVFVSTPTTDTDLKGMGFSKLVRRDTGVYENVTALDGESRIMEAGKPETYPDLKRHVTD